MQAKFNETGKMKFRHIDLHDTTVKDGIQRTFPTVEIAQHIFLILMNTNCSVEHPLSQLKTTKKPSENNASGQT
jgi:hypothetical protein